MDTSPNKETIKTLKDRFLKTGDIQSAKTELNEILSSECAELDKAKVS